MHCWIQEGKTISLVWTPDIIVFELIVVDNGSTDGTKEVIEAYTDPIIRYFWQEGTGGPAGPRNTGHNLGNYRN